MSVWPSLTGAVVLGVNVHAMVALVLGLRAHDATAIARHARRCVWSTAGAVLICGVAPVAVAIAEAPRGDLPEERATRLAMVISEAMNAAAFAVAVVLLPVVAAGVLHVRAARRAK